MKTPFELFGTAHLVTLALLVLLGAILVAGTRLLASPAQSRRIAVGIALFMLVQELFDRGWHWLVIGDPFKNVLPLHLCGLSVFLTIFMLLTRSFAVFELLYFWGLGGATIAILTPDVQFVFPHILYITFFVSHALIVIGVLFEIVVFKYRPGFRSLLKAILILQAYLLFMIPVNWILGTNYLFICEKPLGNTPLNYFGPWPWYVIPMEIVSILAFFGLYSPYALTDWLAGDRTPIGDSCVGK